MKKMRWIAGYILLCVGGFALLFLPKPIRAQGRHAFVTEERAVESVSQEGVTRVLVLGCDRSAGLTDSILILSVEELSGRISILQIPRDTYGEYTERDYKKLNGLLNEKGAVEAKNWLSEALGVPLHYFLILDLDCLGRLVDAVGGVDLEIPMELHYSDPAQHLEIHLPKGPAHLDGAGAEQFVRFRAGYANADLGRLDAQKQFLWALLKKCRSLSNGERVGVMCGMLRGVRTDLDLPAALRLMRVLGEGEEEMEIPIETLPGVAVQGSSGAWYYSVNRAGAIRAINQLLFPQPLLTEDAFDPLGRLDREKHAEFHNAYIAPEESLP